ncbi:hypothetical protein PR048_014066 [Dryococelus australis]|uniref:PABC domain-containing protein n=1 Tax=Dryococelus australis TaxID=614101 RepID=A0ABQ9HTY6_9NEOP|nr:hypothetical protein PR048_014066 [Dryococelus australis]
MHSCSIDAGGGIKHDLKCLQAVVIQGQEPLTASMLAAAPLQEQKQMLGERLFPLIQHMYPELAGKITGMLLEIDNSELLHMLEHHESLKAKSHKFTLLSSRKINSARSNSSNMWWCYKVAAAHSLKAEWLLYHAEISRGREKPSDTSRSCNSSKSFTKQQTLSGKTVQDISVTQKIYRNDVKWDISMDEIVGIVTDSAANMKCAMSQLDITSVSCLVHSLQLVNNRCLKQKIVANVTSTCRRIVGHFHHSVLAKKCLTKAQQDLQIPEHCLIREESTRWTAHT